MAKRIRMMCLMQENSLSKAQILQLQQKSKELYAKYFGNEFRIMPVWMVIPRGQAYIAGKPSTATTVTIPVADNTEDSIRHAYMSEFCEMWMGITHCHINEIIFNAPDKTISDSFMEVQLERIHPNKRKRTMLKLLLSLVKSRFTKGYFSSSLNLG